MATRFTKTTRLTLFLRDQGRCGLCGRHVALDGHIDHIVTRASGGSDDLTNLRLVHASCNLGRPRKTTSQLAFWF